MTFKEKLKRKIKLGRLLRKLVSTIKESPGKRKLDKILTMELLDVTDFEYKKVRDLDLYVRPLKGEIMEVLVFDNELSIYHTTVDDVALRKSPYWKEMVSIRNIMKILNDKDVIVSKGKESLKILHDNAVALLDITYTGDDLALLIEDARQGLEQKSITQIQESVALFLELLDFELLPLGLPEEDFQIFARPKPNGSTTPVFEHLVLFDERKLSLGQKEGVFSPQSELDLAWVRQYALGEMPADLQGMDVFASLAKLALEKAQAQRAVAK